MDNLKATALQVGHPTLEYIDLLSKMLKLDRSAVFRMVLQEGIEVDRKKRALESYVQGKFTLEQAAQFAQIYLGEFLELMREQGIESNVTLEMVKKAEKYLKKAG